MKIIFSPLILIIATLALTGCSKPRSEEYFAQASNKKERNYVLQMCRENEGKRSSFDETECKNAQAAHSSETKR